MLASPAGEPHSDPDFETLHLACRRFDVDLTPALFGSLVRYAQLLRKWNEGINLISRRDTGRILDYHVIDSLAAQGLIPPGATVVDVGTGAGLPGIPVALARPDTKVVLIESSRKKSSFLAAALAGIPVANAKLLNERAESLTGLGGDVVLCRLAGSIPDVLKNAAHHRKPDGTIVLYKTRNSDAELAKSCRLLARHGLRVASQQDILLPLSDIPRRFIVLGSSK
jgi:16S rRNA (guanine527-N7)-methyltransferase